MEDLKYWKTASQISRKFDVHIDRVRADLRRGKFGEGQYKTDDHQRSTWLIDERVASTRYGKSKMDTR